MIASDLSDLPAVCDYLMRIGAEVRSMRTAAVREREGRYFRDRAVIRLGKDGNIAVAPAEGEDAADFEPSDAARHAIKMEAMAAHWPEIKACISIMNAPPDITDTAKDDVFEFRNDAGEIIMLQVRQEKDCGKAYIPWTYWTDNKWRKMEPEGLLPLYGAGKGYRGDDQLKNAYSVFLHEGAKAARYVRRLVEAQTPDVKKALAEHPWGRELQHSAHLGWIGGALSPHRTDWSPLVKAGVQRVYIVADNDEPGHAAVPKIAKLLRAMPITVEAVRFDARFKIGFDLADPFPAEMFK